MRLNRLQYTGLVGNWGMRISLEAVIRAAVAAEADLRGLGISAEAVLLTLRPGSVIVEAQINAPNETWAKMLKTRLDGSERLAKDVVTRVRAINGIDQICSGPITMSGIDAMVLSTGEPFPATMSKAHDESFPANESKGQDKSSPANQSKARDESFPANESKAQGHNNFSSGRELVQDAEHAAWWGKDMMLDVGQHSWWGKYVVAFALSSCGFALVLCLSWPIFQRRKAAAGYSLVSTQEPEIRHDTVPRLTQSVRLRPSPVPASKLPTALTAAQGSRSEQVPLLQSSSVPERRS